MLTLVQTIEDISDFWAWLEDQPFIAVDTETTGFDTYAHDFSVRLAQVGSCDRAWVFDFQRWRGVIELLFEKYRGQIVMHNSKYDVHAFAAEGIIVPWHSLDDTMIALRIAEPHLSAALKNAADRHIGVGASGSQKDLHDAMARNKWTWATVPLDFPPYYIYAGMDVILTSRVFKHPVVEEGLNSPVYALEMEVRAIANTMERNGMRIDCDYSREMGLQLRNEATVIRGAVSDKYGFSATSTAPLARWFMENATGLITKTTAGGMPSTDKETLSGIVNSPKASAEAKELAASVLRVRRTEKLASSYFDNFVDLSDANDHLHADIETLAARTGRMSIRRPGLQTLPRVSEDPETRIVRRAVIPRDPDHVLLCCDSDQIELRLAAALSNDPAMIEAFITADDFFSQSVRDVYGDPHATKSDPRRPTIKTFWYASLYGAGVSKMALAAGVPEARMQEIKRGIESAYPDFSSLGKQIERQCRSSNGWVTNPYGRRLKVDEGKEYTATNYLIQSTAADVLKTSIRDCGHAGLEDMLVAPVHDELMLSVPREDVEEVAHLLEEVMTCDNFALTLTASCGSPAANWAEAK